MGAIVSARTRFFWLCVLGAFLLHPPTRALAASFTDKMNFVLDSKNAFGVGGGDASNRFIGYSISRAGDVDGDGLDDFIIGNSRRNMATPGSAYLVWGFRGVLPSGLGGLSVDAPNANYFVTFNGVSTGWFGHSVSGGSDFDGDGRPDITIGAPFDPYFDNSVTGATYTFLGHARPWPAIVGASILIGVNGFTTYGGNVNEESGFSVASLSKFIDGAAGQLVIGSPVAHVAGDTGSSSGRVDFLYSRSPLSSFYTLGSYPIGSSGFGIYGGTSLTSNPAGLGSSVASAGDVNHDGYEDLIIGAYGDSTNQPYAGTAFVVLGHAGPTFFGLDLANLNGSNGFHIVTEAHPNMSGGFQVGSLGDINGDGVDDFFVSAREPAPDHGCFAYALFGRSDGFPDHINASELMDGTHGFYIENIGYPLGEGGANPFCTQMAIAGVGDVNGDGIDDFIVSDVGLPSPFGYETGVVYLVFGHRGIWNPLTPSKMSHGQGSLITAQVPSNGFGTSVSGIGDVNGDGIADFAIGAPTDGMGDNVSGGIVVVVFGRDGIFDTGFE
jgi:FG-GAP repeat